MKEVYIGTCLYLGVINPAIELWEKSRSQGAPETSGLFILHDVKTQAFSPSTDGLL